MKIIFKNHTLQTLRQKIEKYDLINKILFYYLNIRWRFKNILNNLTSQFDENKRYWINPQKIRYKAMDKNALKNKSKTKSRILNGDWDLPEKTKKFSRNLKYRSFYDHFILNKDWKETEYYKKVLNSISKGKRKFECLTKEDVIKRLRFLDKLYLKIKTEGYKSQIELSKQEGKFVRTGAYTRVRKYGDEIRIAIGRNGNPLFLGGRHRLIIAQLLKLRSVPVKIQIIHSQYFNLRNIYKK